MPIAIDTAIMAIHTPFDTATNRTCFIHIPVLANSTPRSVDFSCKISPSSFDPLLGIVALG